jgi:SAM-dependent methyltransferase
MLGSLQRARRGNRLLGTTRFIVLSNFLRTGIVELLRKGPATLDQIVDFYLARLPASEKEVQTLLDYYRASPNPTKSEFLAKYSSNSKIPHNRNAARAHWNNFLSMADAFGIVRYENGRAQLSESQIAKLTRELEIFGDGYYGVDDLLGVLLKVEALRGETSWIVRPPAFMLETCDAVARRLGIASYWKFSPRLLTGGCRVLDLGCGSGIYSNAFAERGNKCVAVDLTPWVFYRAFLGARDGVQVECCDMNALPERVTREPFTHVISNIAAHHFKGRPALFAKLRERLGDAGEICVLNFNYSIRERAGWNPIAKLKRRFAAQIQYNWGVLEHERGGLDFISPQDVARELEAAGFSVTVNPCDSLKELWFVRGVKH